MKDAEHLGILWALALATGVGMSIIAAPAVAWAAPSDSDGGAPSSAAGQPGSRASDAASRRSASPSSDVRSSPRRPSVDTTAFSPAVPTPSTGRSGTHATPHTAIDTTVRGGSSDRAGFGTPRGGSGPAVTAQEPSLAPLTSPLPPTPVAVPAAPTTNRDVVADPDFIRSSHDFLLFSTTSAADPDDKSYVALVLESAFFSVVLTSGTDPEDNLGFGAASIGRVGNTVATFISPFGNFSVAIPVEDPLAGLFTELVRRGI